MTIRVPVPGTPAIGAVFAAAMLMAPHVAQAQSPAGSRIEPGQNPAAQPNAMPAPVAPGRSAQSGAIPASLEATDQAALRIYTLARHNKWGQINEMMPSLEGSIGRVPVDVVGSANLTAELDGAFHNLREAAIARDKTRTMRSANEITRVVVQLSRRWQSQALTDARMMNVYSRQAGGRRSRPWQTGPAANRSPDDADLEQRPTRATGPGRATGDRRPG